MAKTTGTLIAQWITKAETYRLVALGRHTAGYEDTYAIEQRKTDSLGAEKWDVLHSWDSTEAVFAMTLTAAIKALVEENQALKKRLEPQAPAADELGLNQQPRRRVGPDRF